MNNTIKNTLGVVAIVAIVVGTYIIYDKNMNEPKRRNATAFLNSYTSSEPNWMNSEAKHQLKERKKQKMLKDLSIELYEGKYKDLSEDEKSRMQEELFVELYVKNK